MQTIKNYSNYLGVPPDGVGLSVSPLRSRLPHSLQTAPVGRVTPIPHAGFEVSKQYKIGQKILTYFGLWLSRVTPIPHTGFEVSKQYEISQKIFWSFDTITHRKPSLKVVCKIRA